jgi:hypothetical protein
MRRAIQSKFPASVLTEDGFRITLLLTRATALRSIAPAMPCETMVYIVFPFLTIHLRVQASSRCTASAEWNGSIRRARAVVLHPKMPKLRFVAADIEPVFVRISATSIPLCAAETLAFLRVAHSQPIARACVNVLI